MTIMQPSFISRLSHQSHSRFANLYRPNDFEMVHLTKSERLVKLVQSIFLLIVSIFNDRAKQAKNEAWEQFRNGFFLRFIPSYPPFDPTFARELPTIPSPAPSAAQPAATADATLRAKQPPYPSFDSAFAREQLTQSSVPTAPYATTSDTTLRVGQTPYSSFDPAFARERFPSSTQASFQENSRVSLPVQSSDDSFQATRRSYADITRSTPTASTSNASQPTTRASASSQAAASASGASLPSFNPFAGFSNPDLDANAQRDLLAMLPSLLAQATRMAPPGDSSNRLVVAVTIIHTPQSSDAIEIHSLSDLIDPSGEPTPILEMVRSEKLQAFLSQHIQELSCEKILFLHEKRPDAITLDHLLKTLTREQVKELEAFFLKELTVTLTESDLLGTEDQLETWKKELLSLGDQLDHLTLNRKEKPDLDTSTAALDSPKTPAIDTHKSTIEEITRRIACIHEEVNKFNQKCCQFTRLVQGLSQELIRLDHEAIQEKLSLIEKLRLLKRQPPSVTTTASELPTVKPENPALYSWAVTNIIKLNDILSSLRCKLELLSVEQTADEDSDEEAYMALSRHNLRGSDFYAIACQCELPEHESGPIFAVHQALAARGIYTKKDLQRAKILIDNKSAGASCDEESGSATGIELKQQLQERVRDWILANLPQTSTDC